MNFLEKSAIEMARGIRLRQISSVELITAHLEQIQRVNPRINAAVEILAEPALEQARAADQSLASGKELGPLHGVPISVKDSIDVRGTKTTAGTWGRRNAPPAECDATLVQRLRNAGAIPIAKTNLPDLLFAYESDNLIYGRTNNPYDLTRTPGGSSGGESALIAACGSPLGLGSDAAGSVRVPAAFCGIASIKPTSGCLPRTGHVPPAGGWMEALWQIGPMARYVEDLVLAMEILQGEDRERLVWIGILTTLYGASSPQSNLKTAQVFLLEDPKSQQWCGFDSQAQWNSQVQYRSATKVGTAEYKKGSLASVHITEEAESGDWMVYDDYSVADARLVRLFRKINIVSGGVSLEQIFRFDDRGAALERSSWRDLKSGKPTQPHDIDVPNVPVVTDLKSLPFLDLIKNLSESPRKKSACVPVRHSNHREN